MYDQWMAGLRNQPAPSSLFPGIAAVNELR
jgi:hypothetical protein